MGALAPFEPSRIASVKMIVSRSRPRPIPASGFSIREPRAFPEASTRPTLPTRIPDEMLELCAFTFCQGGFRQAGMTFEQFLLVVAVIKPADLPTTREKARMF
jgi:hypothetical protein